MTLNNVLSADVPVKMQKPLLHHPWRAHVMTLYPEAFPGTLALSLIGKALENGIWSLQTTPLRKFGIGAHLSVDDTPAGGGGGMVLRPDVIAAAVEATLDHYTDFDHMALPLICFSPRGQRLSQAHLVDWAQKPGLIMLSGRFQGIDQRVLDHFNMAEVSLGDFILSGGEIAVQAVIEGIVRLLPGVVGNTQSLEHESFSDGTLEHPHYTTPRVWRGRSVPKVLLSGNHQEIEKWRFVQRIGLTRSRRPDLLD